jgi:hypothetical protein
MSVYFQMLDSLLASERLPPEYAGRMQQVRHRACVWCVARCAACMFGCPLLEIMAVRVPCPAGDAIYSWQQVILGVIAGA